MTELHILIVSLIQGATEFLPVSSSGHLAALDEITRFPDQGPIIDVAAHIGTLFAVILYFYRDVIGLIQGVFLNLTGKFSDPRAKMLRMLIIATLPLVAFGYGLYVLGLHKTLLRDIEVIAWMTFIFGLLLYISDRISSNEGNLNQLSGFGALWIGVSQAAALIPGVSRSGITMTTARFMGISRTESARFSMLMSIPAILAAGTLSGYDVYQAGDLTLGKDALIVTALSAIFGLLAIGGMMALLRRTTLLPFVVYRMLLAGALFWIAYM